MGIVPRLGNFHRLGFEAPAPLIPLVPEATTWFEAGSLRFGVELRTLDEGDNPEAFAGPTIHVYGTDDGEEYLRFDVFDGLPHYHYLDPHAEVAQDQAVPGVSSACVPYDFAANGPMWPWTVECLRSRLSDMLHESGVHDLAERVDTDAVAAVLPEIISLAEPSAPKTHWSKASSQPNLGLAELRDKYAVN